MAQRKFDPEEVRRLYWDEGLSTPQIAVKLSIGGGAPHVLRLMQRFGIPRRAMADAVRRSWSGAADRKAAQAEWLSAVRHSDGFLNQVDSLAQTYRTHPTEGEQIVQDALRFLKIDYRFQEPIGPFIVDFFLADLNCVLEIDTGHHQIPTIAQRDEQKDAYLRSLGYGVLRTSLHGPIDLETAANDIKNALVHFGLI